MDDTAFNEQRKSIQEKRESIFGTTQHGGSIKPVSGRPWNINDFEIGKKQGSGRFGHVFQAREKKTLYLVALKIMSKKKIIDDNMDKQVSSEIEIQMNLRHSNILRLFGYFYDESRQYFIQEYAVNGEQFTHQQRMRRFAEPRAAVYFCSIVKAFEYMHKKHIIHRDIKPENILLDARGQVKIADFGWSVHTINGVRDQICGTPDYISPEMVYSKKYTRKVDHWALGVLLYEFLTGNAPFSQTDTAETFRQIAKNSYTFPDYVAHDARDQISKLLQLDPERRIDFQEIFTHPFILRSISEYNQQRRSKEQRQAAEECGIKGCQQVQIISNNKIIYLQACRTAIQVASKG